LENRIGSIPYRIFTSGAYKQPLPAPNFLFAAPKRIACAAFSKESRMKFVEPHPALQEIRVSAFPQEKPHFAEPYYADWK
jgi:hypothetical protein